MLCTPSPAPPCKSDFTHRVKSSPHSDGGLNVKRVIGATLACRLLTADCFTTNVLAEINVSLWRFLFSDLGARKRQLRLTVRPTSSLLHS